MTQDKMNAVWGDLFEEIKTSVMVRKHIVTILNQAYPEIASEVREMLKKSVAGDRESMDAVLMLLGALVACYGEGVGIGIEMERSETGGVKMI